MTGADPPTRVACKRWDQRGSVLALVPAGFLVLIVLAALAVDSAVAYLGQQQLHDALSAAANDAVAAGVDNRSFYGRGEVSLDPAAVDRVLCAAVVAQGDTNLRRLQVGVAISGVSLRVTGTASVDAVFGRSLPGFGHRVVHAAADATLATAASPGRPVGFGPPAPVSCG